MTTADTPQDEGKIDWPDGVELTYAITNTCCGGAVPVAIHPDGIHLDCAGCGQAIDECGCPVCEIDRAADEAADAYFGNIED